MTTSEQAGRIKVNNPRIGCAYHLAWANTGCWWILKQLSEDGNCVLETPSTKKQIKAKTDDLRHTKKNQRKIYDTQTEDTRLFPNRSIDSKK